MEESFSKLVDIGDYYRNIDNINEAMKYYLQATERGYSQILINIGDWYRGGGHTMNQDIDEAIKFEPHAQSHIPAFPTSGKEDLGSAPPETPQNKPETIDPEQKLEQGKTKE